MNTIDKKFTNKMNIIIILVFCSTYDSKTRKNITFIQCIPGEVLFLVLYHPYNQNEAKNINWF